MTKYAQNKRVFVVRVEVDDETLREALVNAADERLIAESDLTGKIFVSIGKSPLERNQAIQQWLDSVVMQRVGGARRRYERLLAERAQAEERKALEAERQELRDFIARSGEAEARLKELGELLKEFDELRSDPADPGTLDDANERPVLETNLEDV
jgi:hypothetical protein